MASAAHPSARRRRCLALAALLLAVTVGYGRLVSRVDHQAGDDDLEYAIPFGEYAATQAADATSLWNPYSDLGTPLWTTGPYMGPWYPLFPLHHLFPSGVVVNLAYLLHLLWAALGLYLLLRVLGSPPEAAATGGLALALSGQFVMHLNEGYLPDLIAACHLPWAAWLLERALVRGRIAPAALAGLPLGLALLGANPVGSAVTALGLGLFGVGGALLRPERRLRELGRALAACLLAGLVGLLLAAVHWLPAAPDLADTAVTRGFETWTLPLSRPWRLVTYALPLCAPGTKGAEFVGLLTLLLAVAGLRLRRDPWLLAGLGAAGAAALLIVSPSVFDYDRLFEVFPLARMFSYLFTLGIILSFGLAVAAGRGATLVLATARQAPHQLGPAVRAMAIATGVLLVAGLLLRFTLTPAAVNAAAFAGLAPSLLWVAVIGALGAALLTATRRGLLRGRTLGLALLGAVALELILFARIATEPPGPPFALQRYYHGAELLTAIATTGQPGRLLLQQTRTPEPDWALRRNESLIRRFPVANLEAKAVPPRLRALSDRLIHLSLLREEVARATAGGPDPRGLRSPELQIGPAATETNARLLDLAGVAYLVLDRDRLVLGDRFVPLAEVGTARVWRNPATLPTSRLVHHAQVVPDAQVWDALLAPSFDPRQAVLLAPGRGAESVSAQTQDATGQSGGYAALRSWRPGERHYEVESEAPGLLVLSEAWHAGWRARVDGIAVGVLRANGAFLAVPVPTGRFQIRLTFDSRLTWLGAAISGLTLVLLLVLALTRWRGVGASSRPA